jgi:hypothetical protein
MSLELNPCLLRQRKLGSEAVYRLLEESDEMVTVAVVRAPGLRAGTNLRLVGSAAREMQRIELIEDAYRFEAAPLAA